MSYTIALVLLAAGIAAGDRLENVHQAPLTAAHAGGQNALLSLPYESLGQYQNLYKGSASGYTTTAPPLHKTHYTPPVSHNPNAEHQRYQPKVDRHYNPITEHRYNPISEQRHDIIPIVKQAFEPNSGDGGYAYNYETANGISASEYGAYKEGPTKEEGVQSASGSYSYTGPDNVVYTITYTAGLEGFVPQGAHIPTPPPIPEAIQKVIQYAGVSDSDKYQTYDASKYQTYDAGKYQTYDAGKYQASGESVKYQSYNGVPKYQTYAEATGATPSKYTSAVPTPYAGYNPNYSKLASYNSKYEVQDNYARK